MNRQNLEEWPDKYNSIKEFYDWCQHWPKGYKKNNPFDFYLDFIGYSLDRTGGYRYVDPVYKAGENGYGHHERCAMADALKIFEDTSYEDVYEYIDLLKPFGSSKKPSFDVVNFIETRSRG